MPAFTEGHSSMWYFSWILGLGLALTFGVLNAMWYELCEGEPTSNAAKSAAADRAES
jgi:cytochrome bd-I ubiquinol oxidase subunit X